MLDTKKTILIDRHNLAKMLARYAGFFEVDSLKKALGVGAKFKLNEKLLTLNLSGGDTDDRKFVKILEEARKFLDVAKKFNFKKIRQELCQSEYSRNARDTLNDIEQIIADTETTDLDIHVTNFRSGLKKIIYLAHNLQKLDQTLKKEKGNYRSTVGFAWKMKYEGKALNNLPERKILTTPPNFITTPLVEVLSSWVLAQENTFFINGVAIVSELRNDKRERVSTLLYSHIKAKQSKSCRIEPPKGSKPKAEQPWLTEAKDFKRLLRILQFREASIKAIIGLWGTLGEPGIKPILQNWSLDHWSKRVIVHHKLLNPASSLKPACCYIDNKTSDEGGTTLTLINRTYTQDATVKTTYLLSNKTQFSLQGHEITCHDTEATHINKPSLWHRFTTFCTKHKSTIIPCVVIGLIVGVLIGVCPPLLLGIGVFSAVALGVAGGIAGVTTIISTALGFTIASASKDEPQTFVEKTIPKVSPALTAPATAEASAQPVPVSPPPVLHKTPSVNSIEIINSQDSDKEDTELDKPKQVSATHTHYTPQQSAAASKHGDTLRDRHSGWVAITLQGGPQ